MGCWGVFLCVYFFLRPSSQCVDRNDGVVAGVLCPSLYPLDSFPPKPPLLPNTFSIHVETVLPKEGARQVWSLNVDRTERILVHEMELGGKERVEWFHYKILRDFRSGLEFRISTPTSGSPDCIVQPIKEDTTLLINSIPAFILKHGQLLLNFDPSFVNYWGKRSIRDLPSDIWLQESEGDHVAEFGFTNDSALPLAVTSYSRQPEPETLAISNIYAQEERKTSFHSTSFPDVSECLDPTPLLLRIILQAPYAKLKGGRDSGVLESIRRAVAGLAGISLLRVSDVALTEWGGGSAFWFSLRQIIHFQDLSSRNKSTHSTIVFPLTEALRLLSDVLSRHDVTLRVELNSLEHMLVSVERGSLLSIPKGLHPMYMRNVKTKSLSVAKASYTSGSVAGLGLAMGVLGLSIGLLLGFILWKDGGRTHWTNIPYAIGN